MILVDSSILIDSLRSGDPKISSLLHAQGGIVCGVVLAELLHGVRTRRERGLVVALTATLGSVSIDQTEFPAVTKSAHNPQELPIASRYFIAKHVPDLMRYEPCNVGVILWTPCGAMSR